MNMSRLFQIFLFLLSSFLGVCLIELYVRGNHELVITWITNNTGIFFTSVIILLLFECLILSIINDVYITILLTYTFFILLLQINSIKLRVLNLPLLPWDPFIASQIANLLPVLYKNSNIIALIIGALLFVLFVALIVKYTKFNLMSWRRRLILFIFSIILLIAMFNDPNNIYYMKNRLVPLDQKLNQTANGFIAGFVLNMPNFIIDKPPKYSDEYVNKLVSNINYDNNYITSDIKPNIVVIMSESFWELSKLHLSNNGASLNPTLDRYKIGSVISPTFAGETSNVEFEVLTGFSMNNLPTGSIPYLQYISRRTPSLANVLENQGYRPIAIHTYYKYFWNRNKDYNYLGFKKFIGLEDLKSPKKYGKYFVDDAEINNLILKELGENNDPTFIFAITMQNHGSYLDNRYGNKTINITDSYSPNTNSIINTYGTGIIHSDEMLESLLDRINKMGKPTLVVFFGDHLPGLGDAYTESGFIKNMDTMTLSEELKTKQTPLVVWNNYNKKIQPLDSISASSLAPKIMEWAELKSPRYYIFLKDFYDQLPGYSPLIKLSNSGDLSRDTPKNLKKLEYTYQMIQYDLLLGQEYSEENLLELTN